MKKKQRSKKKMIGIILAVIAALLLIQWLFIGWQFSFGPFKPLGCVRLSGLAGNAEQYDFSHIEPMADSPLQGKTVLFLGSSVTNGEAALNQSIPEYFAARMGCEVIREAVDGTTLTDKGKSSYVQRLLNNVGKAEPVDLLVCQLSTNDATKELPLGEIAQGTALTDFDTATVTGAMEYIIAYAKETWGCPVVFYTNAKYDSDSYDAMVVRLHELEEKWGLGVLDLWNAEEFNNVTEAQRSLYMKDDIHPVKAGYRDWWGPELERQLLEYLSK